MKFIVYIIVFIIC